MAETKQVQVIRKENELRAIQSHAGFVSFVAGKVDKIGLEKVLKAEKDNEHYWLAKQLKRLLDFAEQVQLKMVPQKVEGDFNHTVTMPVIQKSFGEASLVDMEFKIGTPRITQDAGHPGEAASLN